MPMPNSQSNLPRNRVHLFDPVSLVNHESDNNSPRADHVPLGGYDDIPMYTALPSTNTSPKAMSPNSRTQAISRGRKELMDMVRDLPETFYELSLRDIVEKRKPDVETEEKKVVEEVVSKKRSKDVGKKKKMGRSKSGDNEKFLLKTSVFPSLFGCKKSKKGNSGSFKIAPSTSKGEESNGMRSSSTSSGSSHGSSRSNSNRNSGHTRLRGNFLASCCFVNGSGVKRSKDKK